MGAFAEQASSCYLASAQLSKCFFFPSFAVRDSELYVCSPSLCKALPTGCSIFSRDVPAHDSNTEIASCWHAASAHKQRYLHRNLPCGIQRRVSAEPRFSRQPAFVTGCSIICERKVPAYSHTVLFVLCVRAAYSAANVQHASKRISFHECRHLLL